MNYHDVNLGELLELGLLRYPEIGAVNFNIIYLILKTIIEKQGLEKLKPNYLELGDKLESNGADWLQLSKKVETDEEEIHKLYGEIQEMKDKISGLETSVDLLDENLKNAAEVVQMKPERVQPLSQSEMMENEEKIRDADEMKNIQNDLKNLKDSNFKTEKKVDLLVSDFQALIVGYGKLGSQVEEMEIFANKQVIIEDQLERLEEKIDKIKEYKGGRTRWEAPERYGSRQSHLSFFKDIREAGQGRGQNEVSEEMMLADDEMQADDPDEMQEEISETTLPEVVRLVPSTKVAHVDFIRSAEKISGQAPNVEEAEVLPTIELQETVSLPAAAADFVSDRDLSPGSGKYIQKFRAAVHAIILMKNMKKSQFTARVAKAHENEARRAVPLKEARSSVAEIHKKTNLEQLDEVNQAEKFARRSTILAFDESLAKDLKEQVILYVKNRLDEMEIYFMTKMKQIESAVKDVTDRNENLQKEITIISDRLETVESWQSEKEKALEVLEEAINCHENDLHKLKKEFHKKMETSSKKNISKSDVTAMENRLQKIDEFFTLQIVELAYTNPEIYALSRWKENKAFQSSRAHTLVFCL